MYIGSTTKNFFVKSETYLFRFVHINNISLRLANLIFNFGAKSEINNLKLPWIENNRSLIEHFIRNNFNKICYIYIRLFFNQILYILMINVMLL